MSELKVTSLDALKQMQEGTIVRLPNFTNGQELVVRLKRPSMMALVMSGKIPNKLITDAESLFNKGTGKIAVGETTDMGELYKLLEVFVDACLMEPTYKEIKDLGITLTDEQMMAIFTFSQEGVSALSDFRQIESDNGSDTDSKSVQE